MKFIPSSCLYLILITALLAGCNKSVNMNTGIKPTASINFYDASYALSNPAYPGNSGNLILVDSHDTAYNPGVGFQYSKYPYFNNPISYGYTYPRNTSTDWVVYMQLPSGGHDLLLLDTTQSILDSTHVVLNPDIPTTVFYADKFGNYRTLVANDPYTATDGKIGLRIINLSPMDGTVFITINQQIPDLLPASTQYGYNSGFIPLDLTTRDTLKIKVYQPGDTTDFLAHTTLDAMPGHAYTLLINGYDNNSPSSYVDPHTGRTVGITPNFGVTAIKNF
jgi:hypothetical protein